ncbi:MAG: hypothetical protein WCX97_01540 [Candidatus Magasanikbacteria bacterium]|jgi:hypothetical protein
MRISSDKIQEFRRIFQTKFGLNVGEERAIELGEALVSALRISYKSMLKKDYELLQQVANT